MKDIIINKGKSGQLLEIILGLNLSNTNLDFEDGELKTNKCDVTGNPLETMFITRISKMVDDLLVGTKLLLRPLYVCLCNYIPKRCKFL